jgi:hypothetical protein
MEWFNICGFFLVFIVTLFGTDDNVLIVDTKIINVGTCGSHFADNISFAVLLLLGCRTLYMQMHGYNMSSTNVLLVFVMTVYIVLGKIFSSMLHSKWGTKFTRDSDAVFTFHVCQQILLYFYDVVVQTMRENKHPPPKFVVDTLRMATLFVIPAAMAVNMLIHGSKFDDMESMLLGNVIGIIYCLSIDISGVCDKTQKIMCLLLDC